MILVYGYGITLLLLMVIALYKGACHFTYCRRENPSYYRGYESYLEAFSPSLKWSI